MSFTFFGAALNENSSVMSCCMLAMATSMQCALLVSEEGTSPKPNDASTVPELFTVSTCVTPSLALPDPSVTEPRFTIKAIPVVLTPYTSSYTKFLPKLSLASTAV